MAEVAETTKIAETPLDKLNTFAPNLATALKKSQVSIMDKVVSGAREMASEIGLTDTIPETDKISKLTSVMPDIIDAAEQDKILLGIDQDRKITITSLNLGNSINLNEKKTAITAALTKIGFIQTDNKIPEKISVAMAISYRRHISYHQELVTAMETGDIANIKKILNNKLNEDKNYNKEKILNTNIINNPVLFDYYKLLTVINSGQINATELKQLGKAYDKSGIFDGLIAKRALLRYQNLRETGKDGLNGLMRGFVDASPLARATMLIGVIGLLIKGGKGFREAMTAMVIGGTFIHAYGDVIEEFILDHNTKKPELNTLLGTDHSYPEALALVGITNIELNNNINQPINYGNLNTQEKDSITKTLALGNITTKTETEKGQLVNASLNKFLIQYGRLLKGNTSLEENIAKEAVQKHIKNKNMTIGDMMIDALKLRQNKQNPKEKTEKENNTTIKIAEVLTAKIAFFKKMDDNNFTIQGIEDNNTFSHYLSHKKENKDKKLYNNLLKPHVQKFLTDFINILNQQYLYKTNKKITPKLINYLVEQDYTITGDIRKPLFTIHNDDTNINLSYQGDILDKIEKAIENSRKTKIAFFKKMDDNNFTIQGIEDNNTFSHYLSHKKENKDKKLYNNLLKPHVQKFLSKLSEYKMINDQNRKISQEFIKLLADHPSIQITNIRNNELTISVNSVTTATIIINKTTLTNIIKKITNQINMKDQGTTIHN